MKFEEFKAHFPEKISARLERYVTDTVLKESRYLFIKTVAKEQFAYCTYCKKQHRPKERLRHKQLERATCPNCKSKCGVRAAGISRKSMCDSAVLVWYEKSAQDNQAITARVISVYRDYSGDFKEVITKYNSSHMYLFQPGNSTYFSYSMEQAKNLRSAFDGEYKYGSWKKHMSVKNIRQAVKGTPFQYSTWEQYTKYDNGTYVSDMTEFFDLAARYPCIEYLTKLGFSSMVWAKLYRDKTYGAINWNGKTIFDVLRLNKAELKAIRGSGRDVSPQALRTYQKMRNIGLQVGIAEAIQAADLEAPIYRDYVQELMKLTSEKEVYSYVLKQIRNHGDHYERASTVIADWRDYRSECLELKIDIREERNLFPNNLHEAHAKLTKQIKMKKDKGLNSKISERLQILEAFRFEKDGLILRPAASTIELFDEGKNLQHCVGRYSERYALGHCDIFLVRKSKDPDKPYFTMEIQKGRIVQCRGYKNKGMTDEVLAFVEAFITEKLTKKEKTRPKLNYRQEVAV
ncbi:PcfJ domain-containing protein [Paenibacillus glucanolyticus]|uniref:PcfJ domain-containing protein n=1 Tax=Paenibacillus glucanolyticus TaxID=59843 RepID=UPI0030D01255